MYQRRHLTHNYFSLSAITAVASRTTNVYTSKSLPLYHNLIAEGNLIIFFFTVLNIEIQILREQQNTENKNSKDLSLKLFVTI